MYPLRTFCQARLFFITLAVYLVATAATAFSWNLASFVLFRLFTGAGIGGEYTAINSTIQELIPARYRGWIDLVNAGCMDRPSP
jgi:MFS family permease